MRVHNGLRNYSIVLFCKQRADHKVKYATFEITEGMLRRHENPDSTLKNKAVAKAVAA